MMLLLAGGIINFGFVWIEILTNPLNLSSKDQINLGNNVLYVIYAIPVTHIWFVLAVFVLGHDLHTMNKTKHWFGWSHDAIPNRQIVWQMTKMTKFVKCYYNKALSTSWLIAISAW